MAAALFGRIDVLAAAADARPRLRDRIEFRFQSFNSASDPAVFAEAMIASAPDVLGLGIYTWNEPLIEAAIPIIHARLPQTRILLGGLSVLYSDANYAAKFPEVDLFFRGDGETAFADVIEHYVDGTYGEIVNGNILLPGVSSHANFMLRADNRAAIKMSEVASLLSARRERQGLLRTPRGRPLGLRLVGAVARLRLHLRVLRLRCPGLGFRHHAIDRVLQEFDVFIEKKVKKVFITDAILGGKRANAKEFLRGLSEPHRRDHGMYIYGFIRPELVDEEFARLLHTANFSSSMSACRPSIRTFPRKCARTTCRKFASTCRGSAIMACAIRPT